MTDSVVKAGIEDVLSSVKRLVSEEGRKVPVSDQKTTARKPGRLVLTDALRISKPAKAKIDSKPLKLEPEYSAEDSAKPMLLRTCDIVRAGNAANKDEVGQNSVAGTAATSTDESNAPGDLAGSLSAKIEALEAAIARTEDQWEPDGDSDDAYSGTPTQALPWNAVKGFAETNLVDQVEVEESEPQGENDEAPQSTATFVRSPEVLASPVVEPETIEPEGPQSVTMEEEALRAMIADVVRQELQGVLGERITRNVRKMVRREIYRALAAEKLE
ncbi:hypothetical protein HW561_08195 [Rhodobacteraceae bacterium B1Z28]|uniref:Cell pole-organizing protein PopZ n=1 Tax=Ruegeria haliotis TaxID=2747601 RepID=A0ABX2PNS4_9RHOB|nr:hypothetical protein [Ruegeria haliotis]NVO55767.1 hypothetical protein [Ruegeria haliotis]